MRKTPALGRSDALDTWSRIVSRLKGAVHVFELPPAMAPEIKLAITLKDLLSISTVFLAAVTARSVSVFDAVLATAGTELDALILEFQKYYSISVIEISLRASNLNFKSLKYYIISAVCARDSFKNSRS